MKKTMSLPCPYGGTAEYEEGDAYAAFECSYCGGFAGPLERARAAAESHFAYERELQARALAKRRGGITC